MEFPKDYMLIEIKEDQNLTKEIKGENGTKVTLFLDNQYTRMSDDYIPEDGFIPHEAKVLSMPRSLSNKAKRYGINLHEISEGDTIYVNHLAVNPNTKLEDGNYFLSIPRDLVGSITSNVLAKKVGEKVIPVYDWNIFQPVVNKYKSSSIIIPDYIKEEKKEDVLKVLEPSVFLKEQGIESDTRVVVNPDTIYPIKIKDKAMWFVRNENVLLKIEE